MIVQIPVDEHTYARVTRDDGYMRMECNCGKRSRWTDLAQAVRAAQDRHAYEIAGSWAAARRHSGYDSRYPL